MPNADVPPRWQETTPHPERARLGSQVPARRAGQSGCVGPALLIAVCILALLCAFAV